MVVNMKKRIISILIICLLIINIYSVCVFADDHVPMENHPGGNASTIAQERIDRLNELYDAVVNSPTTTQLAIKNFVDMCCGSVGFLCKEALITFSDIVQAIQDTDEDFTVLNPTEQDIADWIKNNTTKVNGDIVYGSKYNSFINNFHDNYVDANDVHMYYCASVQRTPSNILNAGFLEDATPIMTQYQNDCYYVLWGGENNQTYFTVIPKNIGKIYGVVTQGSGDWKKFDLYYCKDISGNKVSVQINRRDSLLTVYSVGNTGKLTLISDHSTIESGYTERPLSAYFVVETLRPAEDANWRTYPKAFSMYNDSIQYFNTYNAMDTYIHDVGIGINPYYYNSSVWQNYQNNSSGDYTVSSNNINTVTYGDTISYVIDSHDNTNYYPDNSTVNNWITNTNNDNHSTGGGSGGSGGDSGGSGSGIVSILTALGKAIADLITGIAAFLAGIVGGLVEAITGLLDTLTDLITNFTESIPNIFSPLLGWLFDGLPEEFTAIILLGLTACVIASIIKILRG